MKHHSESPGPSEPSGWQPTRRDFLKASTGLLAATALVPLSCQSSRFFPGQSARFGLVTDIHYADINSRNNRYHRDSISKLNECTDLMNEQNVDFLIYRLYIARD